MTYVEGGRGLGAVRTTATPAPAARPRPQQPRLRVVAGGASRRRNVTRAVAVMSVITVVALFGIVVFHVLLNQGQMQLDRLQSRSTSERARTERLRLDLAELQSPARVVAAARDRLGMVPPASVGYLVPDSNGPTVAPPAVVPLPVPPGPAQGAPAAHPAPAAPLPVPGAIFRHGPGAQPAPPAATTPTTAPVRR